MTGKRSMARNHSADRASGDSAERRRASDRRGAGVRRAADLERRLADVEDLAQANRRELGLQFMRIAQIQAELDVLMKLSRSNLSRSPFPHGHAEDIQPGAERAAANPVAAVPSMHGRRRA